MSSGKSMIINTRERAVSTDINRLQSFAAADVAEMFRYLLIAKTTELSAGGRETVESTQTTPLTALIASGFLCAPQLGGTGLSISAGAMYAVDPTGDTGDDSSAKFVVDTGLPIGTISFLANAGPGIRIDVVEMSIASTVIETDNRDIYDPVTGLFTPTLVNKVKKPKPTYRIRRGTQGAGYPGNAAGWLPLMVAAVPSTATDWDDCTCWDVRPLASDMVGYNRMELVHTTSASNDTRFGTKFITADALSPYALGKVEKRYKLWVAGGVFPSNWHALGGMSLAARKAVGYAPVELWYLYAMFPHGLPRWCEYTPASTGALIPGGVRGIIVLSSIDPDQETGAPSGAMTLPTVTGITAATSDGALLAAGRYAAATEVMISQVGDRTYAYPSSGVADTGAADATYVYFDLPTGLGYWPENAKSVFLQCDIAKATGVATALATIQADVSNAPADAAAWADDITSIETKTMYLVDNGLGNTEFSITVEVPLPPGFPATSETTRLRIAVIATGAMALGALTGSAYAIGWRH